jgi:uncharacterized protein YbjT (DUF2867 family)
MLNRKPDGGKNLKIILFGATGMVGQGVLRECLDDPDVSEVWAVGRRGVGQWHPKLHEILHPDLFDLSALEPKLAGFAACFFCLGVSSAGLNEAAYARTTYELTLGVAGVLARLNPAMVFIYVSGAMTDSTEQGRSMWARIKGKTENALLRLPFKAVYLFRPGYIQPRHGIRSRTRLYRFFYLALSPLYPALKALFPNFVTTTDQVGRAMLAAAKRGYPRPVLETPDINRLGA